MKYEIDLPEDVDHALMEQAAATGKDIEHLIQHAVAAFARREAAPLARRRPDPPREAVEISAPFDLPHSSVSPISIDHTSKRRPDPIAERA